MNRVVSAMIFNGNLMIVVKADGTVWCHALDHQSNVPESPLSGTWRLVSRVPEGL